MCHFIHPTPSSAHSRSLFLSVSQTVQPLLVRSPVSCPPPTKSPLSHISSTTFLLIAKTSMPWWLMMSVWRLCPHAKPHSISGCMSMSVKGARLVLKSVSRKQIRGEVLIQYTLYNKHIQRPSLTGRQTARMFSSGTFLKEKDFKFFRFQQASKRKESEGWGRQKSVAREPSNNGGGDEALQEEMIGFHCWII